MPELAPKQLLKHIARLRRRAASDTTRYLIDHVAETIMPILLHGGFAVAPEYLHMAKNEFGLIWGVNQIPFQDRSVQAWPTILVHFNRDFSPNFRLELCTIPQCPTMFDGHALPRTEANCGHCVHLIYLRKGMSSSYWDQHFGARTLTCFKKKRIDTDVSIAAALLNRVVENKDRELFVEAVVGALGKKHIYESWNKDTPDRPNQSS